MKASASKICNESNNTNTSFNKKTTLTLMSPIMFDLTDKTINYIDTVWM